MTREEAKEYLDNYRKMYAELAPERFLEALDVMLNEPSLPSNINDAAEIAKQEYVYNDGGPFPHTTGVSFLNGFKDGAEWMAEQGASYETEVGWIDGPTVLNWPEDILDGFKMGDKVIVQIRKK